VNHPSQTRSFCRFFAEKRCAARCGVRNDTRSFCRWRVAARFRPGLTMLEMLLAIGLIAMLAVMMFMFYDSVTRTREIGVHAVTNLSLARSIAVKIAEEIRAANGFVKGIGPGVSGDDRMITLQTVVLPDKEMYLRRSIKDGLLPAECDIRQVQYYLAYDEELEFQYPDGKTAAAPMGLVRREIKTLFQQAIREDQAKAVELDLVSSEMKYLRFRYFDGVDWVDKWDIGTDMEGGLGNSLPQAVEVTVGYKAIPPKEEEEKDLTQDPDLIPSIPEPYDPQTYSVVVRLPQADPMLGSRMMRAQRRSRTMGESSASTGSK
jgi:hypothetical protein